MMNNFTNIFNTRSLSTKEKYWNNFIINNDNKAFIFDYSIDIKTLLNTYLTKFWDEIMLGLEDKQLTSIILKYKFSDDTIISVSYLQYVNKNEKSDLLDIFMEFINLRKDNYEEKSISQIIFTYHIFPTDFNIQDKLNYPEKNKINISKYNFSGFNIPLTMDLTKWGYIFSRIQKDDHEEIVIKKDNSALIYLIEKYEDLNVVKILVKNKPIFRLVDILQKDDINFKRMINENQIFFIVDGEVKLKTKTIDKIDYIKKSKIDEVNDNKFITLDIETRMINNIIKPYCISFFDGKECKSFYLLDYHNEEEMLKSCLKSIFIRKYMNYKIYVHNLSNFDGIFLLKVLSSFTNVRINPILRDGNMINIKISYFINDKSKKPYIYDFRDSYLILPTSLRKLAKAFNVETKKGIFPYKFVNSQDIKLDYIGNVPGFEYFDQITLDEYNSYSKSFSNNWIIKEETIKYCEQDCISLYQIINKFNELIFNNFKLNIHRFPTLTSIAFNIYKAHYLKEETIPIINGKIYDFIRESYTGGHTDMYIPKGNNIHCYDVNSLYPFVMNQNEMPVGKPIYFEGDILKFKSDPFGFFNVDIETPENMERPVLQTKVKTKSGFRTLCPLGKWNDYIFSEEMFKYQKLGYKFKINSGYLFKKENIFKEYVDNLYEIKKSHQKDHPMYLISKLLLNSLYGRFGLSPDLPEHRILSNKQLNELLLRNDYIITDVIDLSNGKSLISLKHKKSDMDEFLDPKYQEISISISAAVTSYARIHMSQFLSNSNLNIFYTDTDSIYTDSKLNDNFIGKELGQMKLEYIFKDCVFICPKVYGGITENNEEITKIKGFKNAIDFNQMKSLLKINENIQLNQDKWYKSLSKGEISVKNSIYSLIATENKRKFILDNNNNIISTKPYFINNKKEFI